MQSATVELRNIAGTQAALGWARSHTVVVDRPQGRAGGLGLGFNGAQLLGLTIGGCFCNDLRYKAEELGVRLGDISVKVDVSLDGTPLLATSALVTVHVETLDGTDPAELIAQTRAISMAANSISRGIPVDFQAV